MGIASLGWRFYLIWVAFNAIFVPVRFFFFFLSEPPSLAAL